MKFKLYPGKYGGFTLIDKEDFERVSKYSWSKASDPRWGRFSVMSSIKGEDGKPHVVYLHRFIMGLKKGDGKMIDHINRNTLDNRKANLRICTARQNQWNLGKTARNTSGYIGVSFEKSSRKWIAYINNNKGKHVHLGSFSDIKEAAKTRDAAAKKMRKEYAVLNEDLALKEILA